MNTYNPDEVVLSWGDLVWSGKSCASITEMQLSPQAREIVLTFKEDSEGLTYLKDVVAGITTPEKNTVASGSTVYDVLYYGHPCDKENEVTLCISEQESK